MSDPLDDRIRAARPDLDKGARAMAESVCASLPTEEHRPSWWRRWALPGTGAMRLASAGALALALIAAITFWPKDGASLVAEARGALSPAGEIVQAKITFPGDDEGGGIWDWSMVDPDGRAVMRRFIGSDLAAPPEDEDSVLVRAPGKKEILAVSWTPEFGAGDVAAGEPDPVPLSSFTTFGRLSLYEATDLPAYTLPLIDLFRTDLETGDQRELGTTAEGQRILRGEFQVGALFAGTDGESEVCNESDLVLDADTLLPAEFRLYEECPPDNTLPPPAAVWSIDATVLPATEENRNLLKIGPWSIDEVVENTGAAIENLDERILTGAERDERLKSIGPEGLDLLSSQ